MSDSKELEKLQAYGRKIYDNAQENIYEGIEKLNATIAMLKDFQDICTALVHMADGQQSQIQAFQKEQDVLKSEIRARTEQIDRIKGKETEFEKLQLDSAAVASLLHEMRKEMSDVEQKKADLDEERAKFEEMKSTLIEEKNEAEKKAERFKREKDAAIQTRDEAIAEKRVLEEKLTAREAELAKRNEKIEELRQELSEVAESNAQLTTKNGDLLKQMKQIKILEDRAQWYQNYVEDLERKVADFFEERNQDLMLHYKNYINNSERRPEGRVASPKFANAELTTTTVESSEAKEERTEAADKKTKEKTRETTIETAKETTAERRRASSGSRVPKEPEDGENKHSEFQPWLY